VFALKALNWVSSHSTGCFRGEEGKKERKRKEKRDRLWKIKHILFALLNPLYNIYLQQCAQRDAR